jgi:hypothetical protein
VPRDRWERVAEDYLRQFLIDDGASETRMLAEWQKQVASQFSESGL